MAELYMFADEAGDFTFKRTSNASRYFILATLTCHSCAMANDLLALRRRYALEGSDAERFHATGDKQSVRNAVFAIFERHPFRVDATILEKAKAPASIRPDEPSFYRVAWELHLARIAPAIVASGDKILVTAAALETRATKAAFKNALNNALQSSVPRDRWEVAFMTSASEPMLWAADYCAWAIQRRWALGDTRSHALIADRIASEVDVWDQETVLHF